MGYTRKDYVKGSQWDKLVDLRVQLAKFYRSLSFLFVLSVTPPQLQWLKYKIRGVWTVHSGLGPLSVVVYLFLSL